MLAVGASLSATRFGAYRLQRQRDACARWPIAAADPGLFEQPVSTVPVLDTCLDRVVPQFVAKGSADDIDMTCFAGMQASFE